MKITKRVKWVDIAKAVAILSVIACHTWPGRTTPNITLISFNVPLFFLMTGFTLKPAKSWKEFRAHLKKNFLRILLPAMILLGIMDILFVANGNISGNIPFKILMQYSFFSGWALYDGLAPSAWIYWFMMALFVAKTLHDILCILIPSSKRFYLVAALGFGGMILAHHNIALPLMFDAALVSMLFIEIGHLWHTHEKLVNKISGPLFVACLAFWYWCVTQEFQLDIAMRLYMKGLVSIFEALAGAFVVAKVCQSIEDVSVVSKPLTYLGRNTMLIFAAHSLDLWFEYFWKADIDRGACALAYAKRIAVVAAIFIEVKLIVFVYKSLRSLRSTSSEE